MQIKYQTNGEIERATFNDLTDEVCIAEVWDVPRRPLLYLGMEDEPMVLTQAQVRAILPVLERFAAGQSIIPPEASGA